MKTTILVTVSAFILLAPSTSLPEVTGSEVGAAAPLGKQLLKNRGCEKRMRQGKIPGWTARRGKWAPRSKKGGPHPGPWEGRNYFAPSGRSKVAVLFQEVDLTPYADDIAEGKLEVVLKGRVASYRQKGGDKSQIRLEWVTRSGKPEGAKTSPIYATKWKKVELVQDVPETATAVRVVLVARRVKGTCRQNNNDGCFDDLSLRVRKKRN